VADYALMDINTLVSSVVKKVSPSVIVYLLVMLMIIILRALIYLFPPGMIASQMVNLIDIRSIGLLWLLGWVGVYLAPASGISGMWQENISHFKRFLEPTLVGAGIGLLSIGIDLLQPSLGSSLIKFPASLVVYPLAGILEEIIFRLLFVTILVYVISNVLLHGRWQEAIFWLVSIFLAVFYYLIQLGQYQNLIGELNLIIMARFFVGIVVLFILAALYYRRYGFLAAISLRLGYYIVWHIAWGGILGG
jgi:hypothetical protein